MGGTIYPLTAMLLSVEMHRPRKRQVKKSKHPTIPFRSLVVIDPYSLVIGRDHSHVLRTTYR